MNELFWYAKVNSPLEHLSAAALAFLFGFLLYQCDYLIIFSRYLFALAKHGTSEPRRARTALPAAVVILPTLLRSEEELTGLQGALESAATNDYTGPLYIVAAIDDGEHSGDLYTRLETWLRAFPAADNVRLFATKTKERTGKALAIEAGLDFMRDKVSAGELERFPPIFYNMDADGRLGPHALAHMADRLLKRSFFTGKRPMIVASNVCIAPDTFWGGWRRFFSTRGQLSLLVAAEFLTAISIGKMNGRLIPVTNASGALYCTWSKLHLVGPRWASFMQTLRVKSWLMWWLGVAPPRFADHHGVNPDAQTGPGDDTWMTWLALCARWVDDEIVLELPRTPGHAFYYMMRSYFIRPLAYALRARIETKTPTTVRALFKQRVRWNSSRIQDVQRWRPALLYHWSAGLPVILSTALLLYVHGAVVASLFIWPFVSSHGTFATIVFACLVNTIIRGLSTAFALVVDGSRPRSGYKFLALPLWIPYNFVFNTLTTVYGCLHDLFGFGVNTKFSPEGTHVRSRLSRVAIGYRLRRAFALTLRAAFHNDVPLGTFWFGWHETPWTPNGFEGWSTGKKRILLPRKRALAALVPSVQREAPLVTATSINEMLASVASSERLRDSLRVWKAAADVMIANDAALEPIADAVRISVGRIAPVPSFEPAIEESTADVADTIPMLRMGRRTDSKPSFPPPAGTKKRAA